MRLAKIDYQRGITILHHQCGDGLLWATRGRTMMKGDPESGWHRVARFPRAYPRDLFGFSRPTARAMRADKANLYENSAGAILGIRAGVAYAVENSGAMRSLFSI
ncbi:MAG: hypothetical protein E4G99_09715, partial [Anaerolineales bacterium]